MFIIGAIPDVFISMKKKKGQKGYAFRDVGNTDTRGTVKSPNQPKRSFWNQATGGRMK